MAEIGVKFIWEGDKVIKDFDREFKKRVNTAGNEWVRKAKQGLNKRTNRDGESPSNPNQFPAMVTSHLRSNITQMPAKRSFGGFGTLVKIVGTNVKYGKWLELGTDPYVIKPRKKRALAFKVGGKKVVRRKVNHPGMKRRPWMSLTNRLMKKRIIDILSQGLK